MTKITIKLTFKELDLLTGLAADQLFRREFIDPKFPGHQSDSEEITLGKELVGRLKSLQDADPEPSARPARPTPVRMAPARMMR